MSDHSTAFGLEAAFPAREPIYLGLEPGDDGWEEHTLAGGGPFDGVTVYLGLCSCRGHVLNSGSMLASPDGLSAYVLYDGQFTYVTRPNRMIPFPTFDASDN